MQIVPDLSFTNAFPVNQSVRALSYSLVRDELLRVHSLPHVLFEFFPEDFILSLLVFGEFKGIETHDLYKLILRQLSHLTLRELINKDLLNLIPEFGNVNICLAHALHYDDMVSHLALSYIILVSYVV